MTATQHPYAVRLSEVTRVHGTGAGATTALDSVSLEVVRGSFVAVMGPSGSGKSTLMQCAAGLDRPDSGTVEVDGVALGGLSDHRLTILRRTRIGFIFQGLNLLPYLTAGQNVELPLRLSRRRIDATSVRRRLAELGLTELTDRLPAEMSGGQQQRVAVARALVTNPAVILADEPTGALDSASAADVLSLLRYAVTDLGATIVMVTHDPVAAAYADSVIFLSDGAVAGRMLRPTPAAVAAQMTRLGDLTVAAVDVRVGALR